MPPLVDNRQLRKAFLDSGMSALEVARAAGLNGVDGKEGGRAVAKMLGLKRVDARIKERADGRATYESPAHKQRCLTAASAAKIARALGLDPHEIGL